MEAVSIMYARGNLVPIIGFRYTYKATETGLIRNYCSISDLSLS